MDKQLKKLIDERDITISRINGELEKLVSGTQKKMLAEFMSGFADKLQTDEKGVVINNTYNRNLLVSLDKMFTDFTKKNAPVLIHEIVSGVGSIMNFNSRFYSNFAGDAKLLPIRNKVRESVGAWLGIKNGEASENGYLRTLVENDSARNAIKNVALKTILSQEGFFSSKKKLQELIDGDDERMGAMQKYYRNFTYDLYSQVDRATAQTYADDLKFEFAIYEGGLIERSRTFCKDHNGKVFHKSEILKFKLTEAEPPNYNPFTDLGGYGCRHHLNWIPNALAVAMRPDARKFIEPKKEKAEEKKAEDKTGPKKEPVKTVEVEAVEKPKLNSAGLPEKFSGMIAERIAFTAPDGPIREKFAKWAYNDASLAGLKKIAGWQNLVIKSGAAPRSKELFIQHKDFDKYEKDQGIKIDPEFLKYFKDEIPLDRPNKGGAHYDPSYKKVIIPTTERYTREFFKDYIVYHEYGHALDWQFGMRNNPIVRDGMEAIRKLFKKDKSAAYRDLNKKLNEYDVFEYRDGKKIGVDWAKAEEMASIADTLMALNKSYGFGHTKAYFKNDGKPEAEFLAHAFEVKFAKSTKIWDELAPDLKKELIRILDEVLAEIKL